MWIKHPSTGGIVLVLDKDHIKRLLDEGGQEVADPTRKQEVEMRAAITKEVQSTSVRRRRMKEQSNGST